MIHNRALYYATSTPAGVAKDCLVLAEHYCFTEEELDFTINYDIKYRKGGRGKMTQQHRRKNIVYLDQNWLSDMTKAHLDGDTRVDKGYFTELFKVIQKAIIADKVVCPTSPIHESESNFSSRLSADLRSVDNGLSRGLSFNYSHEICDRQLLEAASKFAGVDTLEEAWWQVPFNRDPDLLDSTFSRDTSTLEAFLTVQPHVNEKRRVRNEVAAPMYEQYKETRVERGLSYGDEVEYNRIQLFREHFYIFDNAELILKQVSTLWEPMVSTIHNERLQRLAELAKICDLGNGIAQFMSSREIANTPFLSIRAKLMAADIVYHPVRKPEASLLDDFDMAAMIVPYVDVFATENYLAELLRTTGVASDYVCNVYRMRQKDNLLNNLSGL